MTSGDIELALIREFSVGGLQIGMTLRRADRRDRIRQAIYVSGKRDEPFAGSELTYAQAFKQCFAEELDRRAEIRPAPPLPGDDDEEDDDPPLLF